MKASIYPQYDETLSDLHPDEEKGYGYPARKSSITDIHGSTPYPSSREHVWDLLEVVDQLVRAQLVRWHQTLGYYKHPGQLSQQVAMPEELNAYLESAYQKPGEISLDLPSCLEPYWKRAETMCKVIENRRRNTPRGMQLRVLKLMQLFSLSEQELWVLMACMLPQVEGRYRRIYAYLLDDLSYDRPTVDLVLQILKPLFKENDLPRQYFHTSAPLVSHGLLELSINSPPPAPLLQNMVGVDERIVDYLLCHEKSDGRLEGISKYVETSLDWERLVIDPQNEERLKALAVHLGGHAKDSADWPVLIFYGSYGAGRMQAAQSLCGQISRGLLWIDAKSLLHAPEGFSKTLKRVFREARLTESGVYIADIHAIRQADPGLETLGYLSEQACNHIGPVFLSSDTPQDLAACGQNKKWLSYHFAKPGYLRRKLSWERFLPPEAHFENPRIDKAALCELLANSYRLTGGQIKNAVAAARCEATKRSPLRVSIRVEDLYQGCKNQSSVHLEAFARLIEPRSGIDFDQLVLPSSSLRQLEELRARMRHHQKVYAATGFETRLNLGKGVIAMFTGSSGTGKTMAAELLGQEFGLPLFKVDLSAVVSKYVGDTEKNLAKVFTEAEQANAILCLDECDALFGKRGEIKDARDRWANTEVNFLLQRIEEYTGVVILTTNLKQNIDPAFWRRIHIIVDFVRPDAQARYKIWQGIFPQSIKSPSDQELQKLADRFNLSGGQIRNAVIDAAFRAMTDAGGDTGDLTITPRHLVLGVGREMQKMGSSLTLGDFGEEYYAWIEEGIL